MLATGPASNLKWALAHRRAFIVGGGNMEYRKKS